MVELYLNTGQRYCYDVAGLVIACSGSGQDAEFQTGLAWPRPRFEERGGLVLDRLTGVLWSRDANPAEFPISWTEALRFVAELNDSNHLGRSGWRLPNRKELRSLVNYRDRNPALPPDHPFENVFLGWYWTSTSAAVNPAYAWYVHLEGGRMFFGHKRQSFLVWPCCGPPSPVLPSTGQKKCYDDGGREIEHQKTGQDGELRFGAPWPEPRFTEKKDAVLDRLTGLEWKRSADLEQGFTTWIGGLRAVAGLNRGVDTAGRPWRLPTINELESLIDADAHSPALPDGHPFMDLGDAYWSSTSSGFEPDWAMVLYLNKGAVGVAQKKDENCLVWPVR